MGQGHNRTEAQWDRDTMGLGHNGSEVQWDWSTMGLGHNLGAQYTTVAQT